MHLLRFVLLVVIFLGSGTKRFTLPAVSIIRFRIWPSIADDSIDQQARKAHRKCLWIHVAGSHTTAATGTLLFWHLFHNPTALERLQDEIRAAPLVEDDLCYSDSELVGLPYLQGCIQENFRISPVFVMPLIRVVPKGGKMVAGAFIAAGTDVSICKHVLHHDPGVFGENVEDFIPERWLDTEYNCAQYLIALGAGDRSFIRRNIATTEICKLIGFILSKYDLEYHTPGW
ncbi:hypothetical protein VTL71DRAFT_5814 [Oculimacula yallundae]|uniref:Cytochrome P450 n=1 Tax=Oculimacula yallundae TaxID=86028 RepID=A0ABR4BZ98_9HELO